MCLFLMNFFCPFPYVKRFPDWIFSASVWLFRNILLCHVLLHVSSSECNVSVDPAVQNQSGGQQLTQGRSNPADSKTPNILPAGQQLQQQNMAIRIALTNSYTLPSQTAPTKGMATVVPQQATVFGGKQVTQKQQSSSLVFGKQIESDLCLISLACVHLDICVVPFESYVNALLANLMKLVKFVMIDEFICR